MRPLMIALATLLLIDLVGCADKPSRLAGETAPSPARRIEGGIITYDVTARGPDGTTKLRFYLPADLKKDRVACVFVAPAGSPLFHGNSLGDGDNKELIPYAKAGMIAIGYELDGPLAENVQSNEVVAAAANAFMKSDGGLRNAKQAIDYVLANVPEADPDRLFLAGHSSAATVALHVATNEPRIRAVAAFAACGDVLERLGSNVDDLDRLVPGMRDFLGRTAPISEIARIHCPVLLFHAEDDANVPITDHQKLIASLGSKSDVWEVLTPTGGHYQSMIDAGIPTAVKWFKGESGHGISPK